VSKHASAEYIMQLSIRNVVDIVGKACMALNSTTGVDPEHGSVIRL